jgi:3-methyladenine DNA glycosylase AlkD
MTKINKKNPVKEILSILNTYKNTCYTERFFNKNYPDKFFNISTKILRSIAKKFSLEEQEFSLFLKSPYNEHRLLGLLFLEKNENKISLYKKYISSVNNWNLVDSSAHILKNETLFLKTLHKSSNLWHRRIAIISQLSLIKKGNYSLALNFCKKSLKDSEYLIHKAIGWMLREIGKVNEQVLENFLQSYQLPRIALNYSIEKLSKEKKEFYLKNNGTL